MVNNENFNFEDFTATDVTNDKSSESFYEKCKKNSLTINRTEWKIYCISHPKFEEKYGNFFIIKKILSNDKKLPDFVAMAGLSLSSFCKSSKVIITNLKSIEEKNKYHAIFILCHGDEEKIKKKLAVAAFHDGERRKAENPDGPAAELYKEEIAMNKALAKVEDKIIRRMVVNRDIHLLGKCAGGGVAMQIILLNPIYKALFLATPSSPTDVQDIINSSDRERFKSMKFRFAWQSGDKQEFLWSNTCTSHEPAYRTNMAKLGPVNNYIGKIYKGDDHEIPVQLLTELIWE